MDVDTIPVSKFKIHCLAIVEQVRKTRKPVRITRYGKPVAEIGPPSPDERPKNWLGDMEGTVHILGDIVGPSTEPQEWDVLR
jgi:prevent-host-death family protein